MGAPRRISRFVHSSIKQTADKAQAIDKALDEGVSASVATEKKQQSTSSGSPSTSVTSTSTSTSTSASTSSSGNSEKKTGSQAAPSELDPLSLAVRHFIRDIGSESMLCRFAQALDITVRDDKLYLTLSRSNNKEVDSRPFVFSNSYIAQDLFEKVMKVYAAVEAVRNQS